MTSLGSLSQLQLHPLKDVINVQYRSIKVVVVSVGAKRCCGVDKSLDIAIVTIQEKHE